jgi:hypothetical protein
MGAKFGLWKRTFRQTAGLSFAAGVLAQAGPIYDKVIFIDPKRGGDGADGSDWDHAVQTINAACNLCYGGDSTSETYARGRGAFAFVFRCFNTGGDTYSTQQIIDIDGVHLFGAGAWYGAGAAYDSAFLVNGHDLTADPELSGLQSTYAGLLVKAQNVIIDGIWFVLRDATNNPYLCAFSDQHPLDDASHGRAGVGAGVFNCMFEGDSGGSGTHYGLGLCGTEAPVVADSHFRYNVEGITLGGGPIRYCNNGLLKNLEFSGVAYGVRPYNASVMGNRLDHCIVKRTPVAGLPPYGKVLVHGFDFTNGQYNYLTDCFVNHLTASYCYVPGTANWFHRCFFGDTGAAATEYNGT